VGAGALTSCSTMAVGRESLEVLNHESSLSYHDKGISPLTNVLLLDIVVLEKEKFSC